jgi:hypothetical protein
MIITASFIWHLFFILMSVILELLILQCLYRSSNKTRRSWDVLFTIDNDENYEPIETCMDLETNLID